jgi:hypothetical protein
MIPPSAAVRAAPGAPLALIKSAAKEARPGVGMAPVVVVVAAAEAL